MRKIEEIELANIEGGRVSTFVSGACAATTLIRLAGLWTPAAPVAYGIGAICVVNAIAGNQGWW
jgi:hypothetical protein